MVLLMSGRQGIQTRGKQKGLADEEARLTTRIAKTLVATAPEEFLEMRIEERILKELGKARGEAA